MSYDLTARSDERFTEMRPRVEAEAVLSSIPGVKRSGRTGFLFQPNEATWMEIDVEIVSEEGDSLDESEHEDRSSINCVRFHIPYAHMGEESACTEVAMQLARSLDWRLRDEQEGEDVPLVADRKPWWKFW